jgi:anaerobic C4-dicarboxylate transporter-like protein
MDRSLLFYAGFLKVIWELLIIWFGIFLGVRYSGVALGLFGGTGVLILGFCLGVPVTAPPMDVVLLIMSVVCASGCLQASLGLDYLVTLAEKILRRYPKRLSFLGPLLSYFLTVFAGTGHMIYAILPIIVKIAKQTGISPEKPLAASVVASQIGISASPLSAATVVALTVFRDEPSMSLGRVLLITIPGTLLGVVAVGLYAYATTAFISPTGFPTLSPRGGDQLTPPDNTKEAKKSIGIFLLGILTIVFFGAKPYLRPLGSDGSPISMGPMISMIMLTVGTLIFLTAQLSSQRVAESPVFKAGLQAVVAIFGVAWLGDMFISHHTDTLKNLGQALLVSYPYLFGLFMFVASILVYSQAATLRIMLPLGLLIGLKPWLLLGLLPAVNGLFVIPNYPTVIAAMEFDDTGHTRVGRFFLNHSFLLPGLIGVGVSIGASLAISFYLR